MCAELATQKNTKIPSNILECVMIDPGNWSCLLSRLMWLVGTLMWLVGILDVASGTLK